MLKYLFNSLYSEVHSEMEFDICTILPEVTSFHKSIEEYSPTPAKQNFTLAEALGVRTLCIKDESKRLGIGSFKGLGASYSIYKVIKTLWENKFHSEFLSCYLWDKEKLKMLGELTFTAASDGNHGKAVAWFAKKIGAKSVIFLPMNTENQKIQAIEKYGAEVVLIDGGFDLCVQKCGLEAKQKEWLEISDTCYPSNENEPKNVMLGYLTIFNEIESFCSSNFDYAIVPVGVGGIAASCALFYNYYLKNNRVKLICVEPISADCLYESLKNKKLSPSFGTDESIMAGLSCHNLSTTCWPILRNKVLLTLGISDDYAERALQILQNKSNIFSGPTGSASLAGLLALKESELYFELNLDKSNVLILNTEDQF